MRKLHGSGFVGGLLLAILLGAPAPAAQSRSRLEDTEVASKALAHNKIGITTTRRVTVYLPARYGDGSRRFPVIYFLHNLFDDHRTLYSTGDAEALFDRAIERGVISDVIVVSADCSTPAGGSFYTNSPVTGNWEDFLAEELVAYVDANFRTLAGSASRGVAGDRMGGYGAIRLGMRRPDVFGSVYALHPVGTGNGIQTMHARPNWDLLANAKSMDDLKGDFLSMIFTAIFQAHLPDPDKAPLFVDLPVSRVGNRLVTDSKLTDRLQESFFLERLIPRYAENLKSLRGLKLDWGRSDGNYDHVYSNQAFTHKLNEFGIPHEAEEYRGGWGDRVWGADGRVYTDMLPFFAGHLVFENAARVR
jgi:S-formylglutathione hydrolase FrmB